MKDYPLFVPESADEDPARGCLFGAFLGLLAWVVILTWWFL